MAHSGIVDLYAGKVVDSTSGLSATNITHFANPQELTIKPKTNTDKAYGGNRLIDQAAQFDSGDITLGLYDLTASEQAFLLNQLEPSEGGVAASAEDEGGFICLFYKTPLRRTTASGGTVYRYGWIYKTQFTPYDDTMKTLQGKPDLSQTPSLSGTAQPTDYYVTDTNGVERHLWHYYVDSDDANCPADIATSWCTSLHVPSADTVAPTVAVLPVDAATDVLTTTNIIWTFSKALNSATVTSANFIVFSADGTTVAGALSLDSTGKIVTFTPAASLTASMAYIAVATKNVTSSFGVALAAASITNFTTAA